MRAVLRDGTERIVARLSQCLMEGMRDGSLPKDMKPVQAALALYDLWLGATLMTKLRHDTHAFKNAPPDHPAIAAARLNGRATAIRPQSTDKEK